MTLCRHAVGAQRQPPHQSARFARSGLAPLELVLWLPVLMFVTALLVNYGVAAAWRVRGETVSRDGVWRLLTPRDANGEPRPEKAVWPTQGTTYGGGSYGNQITALDDVELDLPIVRGPLPAGFGVYETLDPDGYGMKRGTSSIERSYAWLPRLGQYISGAIRNPVFDSFWNIAAMPGKLDTPNLPWWQWEWNSTRRTLLLYDFPEVEGGADYEAAIRAIQAVYDSEGLKVLDGDEEILYYKQLLTLTYGGNWPSTIRRGSPPYVDFHPGFRKFCELLLPEEVREQYLQRVMLDYRLPNGDVRLGGITLLPKTLTDYWLNMYDQEIARLKFLIDRDGDPTGALQSQIDQTEAKKVPLEEYRTRWPEIETRLKSNTTAP